MRFKYLKGFAKKYYFSDAPVAFAISFFCLFQLWSSPTSTLVSQVVSSWLVSRHVNLENSIGIPYWITFSLNVISFLSLFVGKRVKISAFLLIIFSGPNWKVYMHGHQSRIICYSALFLSYCTPFNFHAQNKGCLCKLEDFPFIVESYGRNGRQVWFIVVCTSTVRYRNNENLE